jgi:hypothetical protein
MERGPPATTYGRIATPAVAGQVADGAQVRPDALIGYGYNTYDVPVWFAQVVNSTGTTSSSSSSPCTGDLLALNSALD